MQFTRKTEVTAPEGYRQVFGNLFMDIHGNVYIHEHKYVASNGRVYNSKERTIRAPKSELKYDGDTYKMQALMDRTWSDGHHYTAIYGYAYDGVTYKTQRQLAEAAGVSQPVVANAVKHGWKLLGKEITTN